MRIGWPGFLITALIAIGGVGYSAFRQSPWPWTLLIRYTFDKDAVQRNEALDRLRPAGVSELRDEQYGENSDTVLDLYFPPTASDGNARPVVVWIHGGAYAAGNKRDVAGYLRILAARGYVTVAIGYSRAPGAQYPTPVRQANEALAFLARNANRFQIDTSRLFLAGDSAGAQIAAQLAAIISNPTYASGVGISPTITPAQIKGVILFCGVYDASAIRTDGKLGGFIRAMMWAYFGNKDFANDPRLAESAVNRHVTREFPPAFVSVGNADPLAPQSRMLVSAIEAQSRAVTTLFFPDDYSPPLPHEYQFNLDSDAGREALERLSDFLAASAE